MENKVIVARRMLFIGAVFMIVAILLNFFILKNDYVSIVLVSISSMAFIGYLLISKNYILCCCFVAVLVVGGLNFYIRVWGYQNSYIDKKCEVVCTITKDVDIVGNKSIVVENASLQSEDFYKNNVKLKINFYGGYSENESSNLTFKAGDKIVFVSNIKTLSFLSTSGGVNSLITNGIYYSCAVNAEDVTVVGNDPNLKINLTNKVYRNLSDNLNEDNASLAYAILFGDKDYVQDEIRLAFSGAGLSHLLAVSGLHVSVLFAAIMFLLNRFKANKIFSFIFVFVLLVFYAYLCGFSASVVRAVILSLVLFLSKLCSKKYDALNSLGLAAIITLLINPLNLFNLGFLLSYSCVFSIMLFSKFLTNKLAKGLFSKVVASLVVSFSATIGILPFNLKYFSSVSILSILVNIVFVPIFSIVYIINICASLLSFIGVDFVFKIAGSLFEFFIESTRFLAGLDVTFKLAIDVPALVILLFFFVMFFISNKFMVTHFTKIVTCMLLIVMICVSVCGSYITNNNTMLVYYDYDNRPTIININDSAVINIDTSKEGIEYLSKMLLSKNILAVDNVLVCQDFTSSIFFENFTKTFSVKNVYVVSELIEEVESDVYKYGNVLPIEKYVGESVAFEEFYITSSKKVYLLSTSKHLYMLKLGKYSLGEEEFLNGMNVDVEISSSGVFDKNAYCFIKNLLPYYVLK